MRILELAAIVPPWPNWINLELQNTEVAIVLAAERVLSAHAGDALDPECVSGLLGALVGSETEVHAWLYTFRDYRRQLIHKLGRSAIHGLAADTNGAFKGNTRDMVICPNPPLGKLMDDPDGLIVLSCKIGELLQTGLPPSFLRLCYSIDRIGLTPLPNSSIRLDCYPSLDEMLDNYELVVAACGDHYSDCLLASKRLGSGPLISLIQSAARGFGWAADYLGVVDGEMYERLYERTL